MKLLILPPATDIEAAARALASATHEVVYDARQRIARGIPCVLDADDATQAARELTHVGLESYAVGDDELDASPAILPAKIVSFDDDALILDLVRLPWRGIDAVVRTRFDKDVSTETERADVKIRAGMTGVKVTTKKSVDTAKDRETTWAVVIACKEPPATRVCVQSELDFSALPFPLAPTSLQNFNALVARIEERTPGALHDRRLEQVASRLTSQMKDTGVSTSQAGLAKMKSRTTVSDNRNAALHAARLLILGRRMRDKRH